jgi:hypothetical protein
MNGNFAYLKAWAAGVFADEGIPLPASLEVLQNEQPVCQFTVTSDGNFALQGGTLPHGGRFQVQFTGAGQHPIVREIDFPA